MAGRRNLMRPIGMALLSLCLWMLAIWQMRTHTDGTWDFLMLMRLGLLMLFPQLLRPIRSGTLLFTLPFWLCTGLSVRHLSWHTSAQLAFLLLCLALDGAFTVRKEGWGAPGRPSFFTRWKKCFLPACLAILPAWLGIMLYDLLNSCLLPFYYALFRTTENARMEKGLFLSAVTLLYAVLFYLAMRALVRLFFRRVPLSAIEDACQGIEEYLFGILFLALLFLAVTEIIFVPVDQYLAITPGFYQLRYLWILLQCMVLSLHGLYIGLLLRSVSIRQKLRQTESDHAALSRFTAELEDNLKDMAGVRHDVKNLLLTMGGYVTRSGDTEMLRFWQEQITPCLTDTIHSSEIFASLRPVQDETLKSFLYYKSMQAAAAGCVVKLYIQPSLPPFPVTGPLVRLLGIFFDNALEEAAETDREVTFSCTTAGELLCIRITNTVRPETLAAGIRPGVSAKGEGRGKGLQIAGELVRQIPGCLWNSCFLEARFTQLLCLTPPD